MLMQMISPSNLVNLVTATVLALQALATAADHAHADDVSKARIDGVVVDEAGRPVQGAIVRSPDYYGAKPDSNPVRTGADGSFRMMLEAPMANYRQIIACSSKGARQGLFWTDFHEFGSAVTARVVLKPSHEVLVHVMDEEKKPVSGAFVMVTIATNHPVATAETGPAGSTRLRLPVDAKVDQVIAMKPGAGLDYYENYRARGGRERPPLPAEVTLVLNGARVAVVELKDSANHPVSGIPVMPWTVKKKQKIDEVNLSCSTRLREIAPRSDEHGVVTFDWLPSDLSGGVTFLAVSDEYHQPDNPYLDPAQKNNRLSARLYRNVSASGKVTLPDGRPAGGILVQAEGRGHTNMYFRGYARTKADGTYAFRLYPNQTYIVAIIENEWAAPSHVGIVVHEGQPVANLDFRLGTGTLVEGSVTVGPNRKPMVKEGISVVEKCPGQNADLARWANTDTSGHYHIRVGRGVYQIMAWADQERHELVVHEEPRIERDFMLARRFIGPLRGLVVLRDGGQPVTGATVKGESADPSGRGGFEQAITDAHGRFEVERWYERAWVYARSSDGRFAGLAALTADDNEAKVALRPAATLVGRLVGKDGKPLGDVRLDYSMQIGPKEALAGKVQLGAQAERDGRFTIGGLIPGSRCVLSSFTGGTGTNELKQVTIRGSGTIDLGDLVFDLQP
jgi:hypothetical protein